MFIEFLIFFTGLYRKKKRQFLKLYGKVNRRNYFETVFFSLNQYETSNGNVFKMMLRHPGKIENTIYDTGSWELHIAKKLSYFLTEDKYFIDIGANIGYCSIYVAAENPLSKVIAFEPHPFIGKELIRNVDINDFSNVEVKPFALGNENGEIRFYSNDLNDYNRGMSSTVDKDFSKNIAEIMVEIKRLDDVIPENDYKNIGVIKIDTQGNELDVLKGAEGIIKAVKPVIIFEFESHTKKNIEKSKKEFVAFLKRNNYQTYKVLEHDNVIMPYDISQVGNDFQVDIICI